MNKTVLQTVVTDRMAGALGVNYLLDAVLAQLDEQTLTEVYSVIAQENGFDILEQQLTA